MNEVYKTGIRNINKWIRELKEMERKAELSKNSAVLIIISLNLANMIKLKIKYRNRKAEDNSLQIYLKAQSLYNQSLKDIEKLK
jgi:hypothetical protein